MSMLIIAADTYVLQELAEIRTMREEPYRSPGWLREEHEADRDLWERALADWGSDSYGRFEFEVAQGIEHARRRIGEPCGSFTAVVTWGGDAIAIVRWNLNVLDE